MLRAAFTLALQAYPQAVHRKRAWLSRDLPSTCPHAEHRWLVYAAGTFSTRPGALPSSRRTSRPQPDREIPRFSPVLALTLRPGCSAVPFADRVMLLMFRSSTRITSKRRAMPVDVFSHQSLRRSVSRAFSRASAVLALARRADQRPARARRRWRRRSRACSRALRPGAVSVLLDRQVPCVPGVRAVPQQDGFLLAGRLEAVPGHANIIPDIGSLRGSTMARSLPSFDGHRLLPRPEGQGLRRRFG